MLQRIIDDLNESSSAMLRQALFMAAVALELRRWIGLTAPSTRLDWLGMPLGFGQGSA